LQPQSGCDLCAIFLRHILARRNAAHCFMGGPKLSDCRASGFQTAGTLCAVRPYSTIFYIIFIQFNWSFFNCTTINNIFIVESYKKSYMQNEFFVKEFS
jgi:hypothetical protein